MNNFRLTVTLLFLGTLNASAQQEKSVQKEKSDPSKNVSEWLANSKNLKTFSKAFKVDGENSGGQNALESGFIPFTIFAPSDSALAKIDKEAKSDEEKIENTFLDRNEPHTGYHIFYGEKLLTTANPQNNKDTALFDRLGILPLEGADLATLNAAE